MSSPTILACGMGVNTLALLAEKVRRGEPIDAICHAGAGHPHDAITRGPWGELCSSCWGRLLAAAHLLGDAARAWEARRR